MSALTETDLQRGRSLQSAGRPREAVQAFLRATAAQPDNAEAWCRLASVHEALGEWPKAAQAYETAVKLQPQFAALRCNLGLVHLRLKAPAEAERQLQEAVRLQPNLAPAWNGLGVAQKQLGQLEAATHSFRETLALQSSYSDATYNLANTLQAQEKWDEAIRLYESLVTRVPDSVDTLHNLGCALFATGRIEEAETRLQRVVKLAPKHAEAINQLGSIALQRGEVANAKTFFQKAIALRPEFAEAQTNLGNAFLLENNPHAALECFAKTRPDHPSFPSAQFNAAIAHLLLGELKSGFALYENRWESEQKKFRRSFAAPRWTGDEPLAGKTILIHCEQGMGDTLQFFRYVPLLAARGAQVLLEVQAPLVGLLSGRPGIAVYPKGGAESLTFDFYLPILSLPHVFGTELRTIPAEVPYLSARGEAVQPWVVRLSQGARPKIGLVVSGNANHKNDARRSLPLKTVHAALGDFSADWILVQRDIRADDAVYLRNTPTVREVSRELTDFGTTAGLIAQLDCLVTVDTSVAHLAGAMGKPVLMLLPYAPDWRWMLNRDDSPWYPTVQLFRQVIPGDWSVPLRRIREALQTQFAVAMPSPK